MIEVTRYSDKTVAVFGLAGSGLASARALAAGGAKVVAFDDSAERVAAATEAGIATGDLHDLDFHGVDALLLSPGVPLTHPKPHWSAERAHAAGVPIVGDVGLFDEERRARLPGLALVAITGTNGKSTTTALLGHLLTVLGDAAQVGGNIGRPVLDLDPVPGVAVVECSSYQIDLATTLAPDVGALLNLSPDHIDRHGTYENYAAIKERLVAASDAVVIGVDDADTAAVADRMERAGKTVLRIGTFDSVDAIALGRSGVGAVGETLYRVTDGVAREIASLAGIGSLRGRHNAQNASAAVALAIALGHTAEDAVRGLATFPGLVHRMEEVGRADAVLFVNDSKATNAQSTRQALASFEDVYWIAGGVPKAGGITELADLFGRVKRAYLIGEAAQAFAKTLTGRVNFVLSGTLEAALDAAASDAEAAGSGVVLLSPACASFDQFRSFEARGDRFRTLVGERLHSGENA
ncbi:UDP-N-acetylmuramoyl-L-alanine--D-glutamate ligase [Acuticoccus sp. M5D2P5]|uniref:UDP-N-acetylmuramoyl-L-alanine--D-glutamate ligase n=1 Tax=Acuticoccus kalidii TaxID=2910977 RepID=UPI001F37C267|nr:UDP-N-acetylmuramoyl-L-alanine--D-glutamate ligase [Acuticoccus kalidii]MCF3936442.1 UDP-N-acetylmuramoyl-L-alanine--D-glutamate ligase [Acuticoccus kalidii]